MHPERPAFVLLASPLEELPLYSSQVTGPERGAPRSSFWTSGDVIVSPQEVSKCAKLDEIF